MVVAMRWRTRKSVEPFAPAPAKLFARAPAPPRSRHIVPLSPVLAPATTTTAWAAKVPGFEIVLPVTVAWTAALPDRWAMLMPARLLYCLIVLPVMASVMVDEWF